MKTSIFNRLLASVVLIVFIYIVYCWFSNEELASKVEWSVVQSVESTHLDKPGNKIEIAKMDGYSLVGIPVSDARKEIWIMLNAKNPPYYKQLSVGNYKLSKQDLKVILTSNVVSSTVVNCLESHVESP